MDKDPQSDSSTVVTLLLIAVPLIVYLLYFIFSKKKGLIYGVRGRRELLLRAQGCSSAECVRCTKYQIVREEALAKFRLFQEGYGISGLDRVSASLDDMRGLPTNPAQQPNVLYVPGLKCSPLWNDGSFSRETKLLERQWLDIRNEFERARTDITGWKRNSTEDDSGGWTIFCLYNQGEKIEKNCSRCPKTTAVVESMSSFMRANVFGNAMFSVVEPGTKIAEHYGPCNIRIRCHLGLHVPATTTLTVSGAACQWHEGCCICFDDSFLHGVSHSGTGQMRAVFIVDLWHPSLTMKERDALNAVFQP